MNGERLGQGLIKSVKHVRAQGLHKVKMVPVGW